MTSLAAFDVFASRLLSGQDGIFFSANTPQTGTEFIYGTGKYREVDFDDLVFPQFVVSDFLGEKQTSLHFSDWTNPSTFEIPRNFKSVLPQLKSAYFSDLHTSTTETKDSFLNKVTNIQQAQRDGEFWVLNFAQEFSGKYDNLHDKTAFLASFYRFLKTNQHHCGGIYWTDQYKFISFSPEIFLHQQVQKITTYPIKGTGPEEILLNSDKEISELHMVTDLLRNDLGQICNQVTVERERFLTDEVDFFHAQSEISGLLKSPFNRANFTRLLPAGSISGAPKQRVLAKIQAIENFSRELYTGTFGVRFSEEKSLFNILIRTIFINDNQWKYPVGSGITIESVPEQEYLETFQKTNILNNFLFKKSQKKST